MTGRNRNFLGDFVPEWCALAALALADALLAAHAHINFAPTPGAYWLIPPLLVAAFFVRQRFSRLGLALDYCALLVAADTAIRVLTYVTSALAGPLWDAQFAAMDRALGFDWIAYFHFVVDHPQIGAVLGFLYYRIGLIAVGFFVLMCWRANKGRMREIFWLLLTASVLTAIIAQMLPVLGPFHAYGLAESCGPFVLELERLRAGLHPAFPLGSLQGVVQCPSFHTTLALGLVYAFRGMGMTAKTINILCVMILFGVPVFGGHYLVDMIGGALVLAMSLAVTKAAPLAARKLIAGYALPGSAARYGDAY